MLRPFEKVVEATWSPRMTFLKDLSKSKSDCMLGGVCGGLGASTPIPTWIWRAGFLVSVLFFGTGALVYLILWIVLPEQKPTPPPTASKGDGE